MAPENAKVVVFEDRESNVKLITMYLEHGGHKVVGLARNMEEARDLIPQLGELEAQVAVVDGTLDNQSVASGKTKSGDDGTILVQEIKAEHPSIATLGFPSYGNVRGADRQLSKLNMTSLAEVIDKL